MKPSVTCARIELPKLLLMRMRIVLLKLLLMRMRIVLLKLLMMRMRIVLLNLLLRLHNRVTIVTSLKMILITYLLLVVKGM